MMQNCYAFSFFPYRTGPLQIGLCCYLMYLELGYAVFAGIVVLIIAIPLNVVAGGITKKFQMTQMKKKDERSRLINEILSGIKVCCSQMVNWN